MPVIDIYADSKGSGVCRSCGAKLTWAETVRGRKMPFEGEIVVLRTQGDILGGGRVVESVDTEISPTHWERCPNASEFRRKRN